MYVIQIRAEVEMASLQDQKQNTRPSKDHASQSMNTV